MIRLTAEPRDKLLKVAVSGLLTLDEVDGYLREKEAALARMGLGSGEFLLLVDVSRQVQSQDVINIFQTMLRSGSLSPRKLAVVNEGALPRLQSKRIAAEHGCARLFGTLAEAEHWLLAD